MQIAMKRPLGALSVVRDAPNEVKDESMPYMNLSKVVRTPGNIGMIILEVLRHFRR